MKKWFKKIITGVAAVAMTICLLPAMNVKAATNYYVVGGGDELGNWTPANSKEMTESGGVYSYSFTADATKTYEFQILPTQSNWDGQIGKDGGGNFKFHASSNGTVTIKFDPSKSGDARISYVNGASGEAPVIYDKYYIIGSILETETSNGWGLDDALEMTKEGSVFKYSFDYTAGKGNLFKILIARSWDGSIGPEAGGNFWIDNTKTGRVTITFDPTKSGDARISVDIVEAAPENNTANTQNTQNTTNEAEETVQPDVPAVKEENTNTAKVYIYAKTDASWGDEVYLYAWQNDADTNYPNEGAWPGNKMEKMGNGWYRLAITEKSDRVIINNGKDKTQTQDITITAGKSHAFTVAADGKYEASELPKMGDVNAVPYVVALLVGMGVVGVAIARKRRVA